MERLAAYGEPVEGTPFGRYRLIELLGRGGMGEVWRAHDTLIGRTVALKVLPASYADDPQYRERFRREALKAASLNQRHIVTILDVGEVDGRLFVTMPVIEGRDLQALLDGGPLLPQRAVAIIEQVAAALTAAHKAGLVHRDVKPSNILLAEDDFAYLIDFGIARAEGETGLTSTGLTIGTWSYMAPERFRTGHIEPSTDTYSLACVLYQCLTGKLPFPGTTFEQIALAHLMDVPPKPSVTDPARIPAAMDEVTTIGLAKEPALRYRSAAEFAAAARAALASATDSQTSEPTPPKTESPQTTPDQADAETAGTILADTQAAAGDRAQARAADKPPASSPTKTRPPAKPPASSPTTNPAKPAPSPQSSKPPPARQKAKPFLTPERDSNRRGSGRRIAIGITLVALLVLAALAVGRTVIRSDYYVTAYNGAVTIMQGIQLSILGVPLHQPYSQACLNSLNQLSVVRYGQAGANRDCQLMKPSDLAESARAQVAAGLSVGTLDQANAQLRRLATESLLPLCPLARPQSPPASTPPPPTTTGTPGESEGPPTV
ncbi:MAG: eukaryotic-like serine/threonine-protein kinase, partial [Mycobacterium sp.]|nr:eukaryotic-like serine/threonine-protein kinase [Mycobacterium sp.]